MVSHSKARIYFDVFLFKVLKSQLVALHLIGPHLGFSISAQQDGTDGTGIAFSMAPAPSETSKARLENGMRLELMRKQLEKHASSQLHLYMWMMLYLRYLLWLFT